MINFTVNGKPESELLKIADVTLENFGSEVRVKVSIDGGYPYTLFGIGEKNGTVSAVRYNGLVGPFDTEKRAIDSLDTNVIVVEPKNYQP